MVSTFHGIEMGKRSLITHTQATNVTGHNLNNLNTEGYTRQVINLQEYEPIFMPDMTREERAGQMGQGVITQNIVRVRDVLIDNRLIFERKDLGYYEIRNKYIHQMELIYSEPTIYNDSKLTTNLRKAFDDFMSGWQDLANHPDEKSARTVLLERANILTHSVRLHYNQFTDLRNNVDLEIQNRVNEINDIAKKIAHLNDRILRSEAIGDNPNDLRDERDRLIDKLSKIADIQISREDNDELIIYIGGRHLVQGQKYEKLNLVANAENDGYYDVYWKDGEKLVVRGGELSALLELRDVDLYYEIKKIDSFAANVTDLVNEIHRDGFGLNSKTGNNFFVEFPFVTDPAGNYDRNRDGVDDSTYIFRVSGKNKLELYDKIGIRGTMNINGIDIAYYETDTLEQVIRRINESGARVNAFLNPQSKLTIKADYELNRENPDFVIRNLRDDGLFLTGYAGILRESGDAGAFNWENINQVNQFDNLAQWSVAPQVHPSAYMEVDQKIKSDISYIAAASGIDTNGDGIKDLSNGVGDSENALRISSLKHSKVMVGMSLTFSEYFEMIIADIGSRGSHAEKGFKSAELLVQNLENIRKSISGVNVDEEFANLIKFQHGYNASAKFVAEVDKMIETIIFRLGV
ncbi:MAG TPA: flagellar hook-associated protein FlgK [Spirochaetota bacterium]|nr:flagellar hook-associated protein FlgK [Spirochaetota bacterium]HOL55963.1 flagellar hook-associated protein FlgK [Spirochaetota bacterium]HPP03577.1 flagellar hook-associated protein FlgK [Spirochaetota bacterium]